MKSFSQEDLSRAASRRAPGYAEDVMRSAEKIENGKIWLSDEQYERIGQQYASAGKGFGLPGTELKALLAGWPFRIKADANCACNSMAHKMDKWGPDASLDHIEEIVGVMERTARARGLPFSRAVGKTLVHIACRRARKQAFAAGSQRAPAMPPPETEPT